MPNAGAAEAVGAAAAAAEVAEAAEAAAAAAAAEAAVGGRDSAASARRELLPISLTVLFAAAPTRMRGQACVPCNDDPDWSR
jgi:hypothetical protein